ncbi:hypothetical protein EV666_13119 [Camelimonas lactis]|uniref:Uncharacterized protein n=1 Tax=Camelimonas lactis TaxID=659006 RepID=A0A4V2RWB2_9HYPH|nr:hypothetical protein EV666_13119 [Camelimonas lactis]
MSVSTLEAGRRLGISAPRIQHWISRSFLPCPHDGWDARSATRILLMQELLSSGQPSTMAGIAAATLAKAGTLTAGAHLVVTAEPQPDGGVRYHASIVTGQPDTSDARVAVCVPLDPIRARVAAAWRSPTT